METVIGPAASDICDTFGGPRDLSRASVASVQPLARDTCDTSARVLKSFALSQRLSCPNGNRRKCPSRVRHLEFVRDYRSYRGLKGLATVLCARGTHATVCARADLAAGGAP
jgi:hypothetical protein